jgi:hypothetical protein
MRSHFSILGLIVALLTLAGCSAITGSAEPPSCTMVDGVLVSKILSDRAQEWDDALKLADSTPRNQLAPQIARLQELRRGMQSATWPSCAATAKTKLIAAMDAWIDVYINFMSNPYAMGGPEAARDARRLMAEFNDELAALQGVRATATPTGTPTGAVPTVTATAAAKTSRPPATTIRHDGTTVTAEVVAAGASGAACTAVLDGPTVYKQSPTALTLDGEGRGRVTITAPLRSISAGETLVTVDCGAGPSSSTHTLQP